MSAHVRMGQAAPVTDDLLREITQQIVAAFAPEAVILFGSRAYGQPEPDSDIDLLVVTDALKTRSVFERHRAVSDLFPHRRFTLDVMVRTPRKCGNWSSTAPHSLTRSSHRARFSMSDEVAGWLQKAEADFQNARILLRQRGRHAGSIWN